MKKIIIILCFTLFAISAWAQINPELMKKAEAGDAEAQFNIGLAYIKGQGVAIATAKEAYIELQQKALGIDPNITTKINEREK